MKKQPKGSSQDEQENDAQLDDTFSELVQALVEQDQEQLKRQVDPFENYIFLIQSHFHKDSAQLSARLAKGYRHLLHEVDHS